MAEAPTLTEREADLCAYTLVHGTYEGDVTIPALTLARALPDVWGYDPVATADACDYFDVAAAQEALDFFPQVLRHVKGPKGGSPFYLETWQAAVIVNLFGWFRPGEWGRDVRRYNECMLLVARKNGKTPFGAGIILFMLTCDDEPGAEFISAAGKREQAAKVFEHAEGMVRKAPGLKARLKVYATGKSIVRKSDPASVYKVIAAEADTEHGGNLYGAAVDELHVTPADLVEVIETSVSARDQYLILWMSTADFVRESACNEKHDEARDVATGRGPNARFLPVLCEAAEGDDITSEVTWRKANPNLGVSKTVEYMQSRVRKALRNPRLFNGFKRVDLNIRTAANVAWFNMEIWNACAGALSYLELVEFLKGRKAWGALDLASVSDLNSFSLFFPCVRATLTWTWVPKATADRREEESILPSYLPWITSGMMTATKKRSTDYAVIRKAVGMIGELYNIQIIAVDRWQAGQIQHDLEEDGFDVMPIGMGFASLSQPSKVLEAMVTEGELIHGAHPVLDWCASNVQIAEDDRENIKPTKPVSKHKGKRQIQKEKKIDCILTLCMSIAAAGLEPPDPDSVYEKEGIFTI